MECLENIMVKDHLWPEPCRSEAITFHDYILENYSLEEVLAISGIMEALIKAKMEDYQTWLEEIS